MPLDANLVTNLDVIIAIVIQRCTRRALHWLLQKIVELTDSVQQNLFETPVLFADFFVASVYQTVTRRPVEGIDNQTMKRQ